jgi:hypothetical protein
LDEAKNLSFGGGEFVKFKSPVVMASAISLLLLLIKFVFSFSRNGMEYNIVFGAICLLSALGISVSCFWIPNEDLEFFHKFKKNPLMGFACAIICVSFALLAASFWKDTPPNDLKKQYPIMFFLSCVSSFVFAFSSFSHFTGKNKFKFLQILIFAPVIYFIFSLTFFLSLDSGTPDPYNVISQSFLSLFFVYYTQVFVGCSKKINIPKRLVAFGLPSILSVFSFAIPKIFLSNFSWSYVLSLAPLTHILIVIYIALFLYDGFARKGVAS